MMKISYGSLILMKGMLYSTLYALQGSTVVESFAISTESENMNLWHTRLGHILEKRMHQLCSINLLSKKLGSLDFCEYCIFGK